MAEVSHNHAASERQARLNFLGIISGDSANLHSLREPFIAHAREFADRFYQHLLNDPHTAPYLHDPVQLQRLKAIQANYFAELLEGVFDEAYFAARTRVGDTHHRVGLAPQWYLGAYNQYIQISFPIFARVFGPNLEAVLPRLLSLVKVIFLDVGLALETWFRAATEQLEQRNHELQQALRLYWQAQRREEQLRHLASHEVRGGLAAVITTIDDLLEQARGMANVDGAVVEELMGVSQRCWALSHLLREMLTAREPGGPGWVDTAALFDQLPARMGLYAAGRQVQLRLPDDPPRVWADPVQLREVFAILVSNAVRYLDKDPGHIDISWRRDGDFVRFEVADDGPGIPAELRGRLFEPFVRGPSAPGRPAGTGLGLYFARDMIEQNGGRLGVESAPRQGACFWFTVLAGPVAPA